MEQADVYININNAKRRKDIRCREKELWEFKEAKIMFDLDSNLFFLGWGRDIHLQIFIEQLLCASHCTQIVPQERGHLNCALKDEYVLNVMLCKVGVAGTWNVTGLWEGRVKRERWQIWKMKQDGKSDSTKWCPEHLVGVWLPGCRGPSPSSFPSS